MKNLDTVRLDWICQHGAKMEFDSDGEKCRVSVFVEEYGYEPVCGWKVAFDTTRDAIDAAMKVMK